MIRRAVSTAITVAVLISLGARFGYGSVAAFGDATPTPAIDSTPSAVPAAPSNVTLDLSGPITWQDNSDNEDGFRIVYSRQAGDATPQSEEYQVGANVTSVALSATARAFTGDIVRVSVVAFNASGESQPAVLARALEDSPPPVPVETASPAPPQLPGTGTSEEPITESLSRWLLGFACLAFVMGAWTALAALRRR
ncbi:MAG: hypothetical protein WEB52_13565 [Dehalococcoidia bacterium]